MAPITTADRRAYTTAAHERGCYDHVDYTDCANARSEKYDDSRFELAAGAAASREQNRNYCSIQPGYMEKVQAMYESVQQTPQQMAFFHLAKTCQIGLDEAPLTWKQADETYREWEKSQEGGTLPRGCSCTPARHFKAQLARDRKIMCLGTYGTAIECGHAVDDARVRLGAGFRWTAVRKMKKGVPSVGADGLPLYKYQAVLGDDCGNKRDDYNLNYYWRIAGRAVRLGWPCACSWRSPGPC